MVDTDLVRIVLLTVAVALLGPACGDPAPRRKRPTVTKSSDKAALFGDASLVPTREGERTRREIALAEEIRVAVELLHGVERARANVTLDEHGAVLGASVVIRAEPAAQMGLLRTTADEVARHALALDLSDPVLSVEVSTPPLATDGPVLPGGGPPALPLMLALVGLGFSLGLTFDRSRRAATRVWRDRTRGPDTAA